MPKAKAKPIGYLLLNPVALPPAPAGLETKYSLFHNDLDRLESLNVLIFFLLDKFRCKLSREF